MRNVTWDDLTMNVSEKEILSAYEDWNWLLDCRFKPIMITKFGDMFFQKEDRKVYFLDTIEGSISEICTSDIEFKTFINKKENIENYLLSYIVYDLVNQDKVPKEQQCYSFTIPPILGGKIEVSNVSIGSFLVNVSISGQIHRQIKYMPEGTVISEFKFKED